MGLTPAADELITAKETAVEKGTRTFSDGRTEPFERTITVDLVKKETCGTYLGMFDTEFGLYRYTLPNGKWYEEYVQAAPWSSGPLFYLALKDENGPVKESLWSDEELEDW